MRAHTLKLVEKKKKQVGPKAAGRQKWGWLQVGVVRNPSELTQKSAQSSLDLQQRAFEKTDRRHKEQPAMYFPVEEEETNAVNRLMCDLNKPF